jgi:hypothetical protein
MEGFLGIAAWIVAIVVALTVVSLVQRKLKAARMRRRAAFIASYVFPPGLEERMERRFPGLAPEQRREVLEGLRQYFLVMLAAQAGRIFRRLGMPSRAVDEAWQEFTCMPRDYSSFCRRAFGRVPRHRGVSTTEGNASSSSERRRSRR